MRSISVSKRREQPRAADRVIEAWRPWLDSMTDDTHEVVTLLIRGTCEAAERGERYRIKDLAATVDRTLSSVASRFSRYHLPSLRTIATQVRLLSIIHHRERHTERGYCRPRRFTLDIAADAAGCSSHHDLLRFLRRNVPGLVSAGQWINTADFADVATNGARLLFDEPEWAGFHVLSPNPYPVKLGPVPRCSECGRPRYN